MTREEAARRNQQRKYPVRGPIWEDGRIASFRYFLDHNTFEEGNTFGFSLDEVRFILAMLEEHAELLALVEEASPMLHNSAMHGGDGQRFAEDWWRRAGKFAVQP